MNTKTTIAVLIMTLISCQKQIVKPSERAPQKVEFAANRPIAIYPNDGVIKEKIIVSPTVTQYTYVSIPGLVVTENRMLSNMWQMTALKDGKTNSFFYSISTLANGSTQAKLTDFFNVYYSFTMTGGQMNNDLVVYKPLPFGTVTDVTRYLSCMQAKKNVCRQSFLCTLGFANTWAAFTLGWSIGCALGI